MTAEEAKASIDWVLTAKPITEISGNPIVVKKGIGGTMLPGGSQSGSDTSLQKGASRLIIVKKLADVNSKI
jgi:hypothetical protein